MITKLDGVATSEETILAIYDLIEEGMKQITANVVGLAQNVLCDAEYLASEFEDAAREQLPDELEWCGYAYDDPVVRLYLGNYLSMAPSGKYYTPIANSNVDECPFCKVEKGACRVCNGFGSVDAYLDNEYWGALDERANELGYWIENGDGDPLDVFVCRSYTREEAKAIVDSLDK